MTYSPSLVVTAYCTRIQGNIAEMDAATAEVVASVQESVKNEQQASLAVEDDDLAGYAHTFARKLSLGEAQDEETVGYAKVRSIDASHEFSLTL